jgi:hypothetical protein
MNDLYFAPWFHKNNFIMLHTILRYGIISGLIVASLMFITQMTILGLGVQKETFDYGMIIGYTTIFLASMAIYYAVRHYRDVKNENQISFVQGLLIGLGVTLISCVFYSLMWMIIYYNFMPDFMDQYANYSIEKMQKAGATVDEINQFSKDLEGYKTMYKSPVNIFFLTMIEPLPVTFSVSLLSALILKRK